MLLSIVRLPFPVGSDENTLGARWRRYRFERARYDARQRLRARVRSGGQSVVTALVLTPILLVVCFAAVRSTLDHRPVNPSTVAISKDPMVNELALMCDFVYAVRTARFALTEVSLGIIPGAGGTQNLPRAVGERRAKEIIYTARPFSAEEAHRWGLVNRLCEPGSTLQEAIATAVVIAGNAPLALRQAKKAIRYGSQMEIRTAYRFEVEAYNQLVDTEDRREGILAFNEKRRPQFKGR